VSAPRRLTLSERDVAVLRSLLRFRLMTTTQLQRVVMTEGSTLTQARRMRSTLQRLCRAGVISQLDRHVGGIRAGSEGTVNRLTGRGLGVLARLDGVERRRIGGQPGERFVRHVLAVSELYVRLSEHVRNTSEELLAFDAEPLSWRSFTGAYGGVTAIRPDAFVRTASGDAEHISFVEVDLATESLSTVARKCHAYITYWRSGDEQRRLGTFPRVVWATVSAAHAQRIATTIGRLTPEAQQLFVVTTAAMAHAALLGRVSPMPGGQP
jgi:Replication-relaxation